MNLNQNLNTPRPIKLERGDDGEAIGRLPNGKVALFKGTKPDYREQYTMVTVDNEQEKVIFVRLYSIDGTLEWISSQDAGLDGSVYGAEIQTLVLRSNEPITKNFYRQIALGCFAQKDGTLGDESFQRAALESIQNDVLTEAVEVIAEKKPGIGKNERSLQDFNYVGRIRLMSRLWAESLPENWKAMNIRSYHYLQSDLGISQAMKMNAYNEWFERNKPN